MKGKFDTERFISGSLSTILLSDISRSTDARVATIQLTNLAVLIAQQTRLCKFAATGQRWRRWPCLWVSFIFIRSDCKVVKRKLGHIRMSYAMLTTAPIEESSWTNWGDVLLEKWSNYGEKRSWAKGTRQSCTRINNNNNAHKRNDSWASWRYKSSSRAPQHQK